MDGIILQTENLTKCYGNCVAINNLNIQIPKGKIIGLLGPNGSGKTTFIKIAAGLLCPTSGRLLINGNAPGQETKRIVSYLPERTYFDTGMRVCECIEFFSDFYSDFDLSVAARILSDFNIDPKAKLKTLSKGTKEKVQLGLVMARRAELYILDEPIAGVDPSAREYILKSIISAYNKDATVIISTHLITDIEPIIDRAVFINNGRVVLDADVNELCSDTGKTLDEYFREVFRCSQNY